MIACSIVKASTTEQLLDVAVPLTRFGSAADVHDINKRRLRGQSTLPVSMSVQLPTKHTDNPCRCALAVQVYSMSELRRPSPVPDRAGVRVYSPRSFSSFTGVRRQCTTIHLDRATIQRRERWKHTIKHQQYVIQQSLSISW